MMIIDNNNRNKKNKNNKSDLLITLIALSISLTFATTIRVVSSFAPIQQRSPSPLLSFPLSSETMTTRKRKRTMKLLQSAISSPIDYSSLKILNLRQEERKGRRGSSSSSCSSPSSSSVSVLRQLDANICTSPQPSITTNDYDNAFFPAPSLILPDTPTKEEQLAILRSMSMIELKLACSRRNIQYGKFLSSSKNNKEDYIEAISKDMEYTITGLIRPGTMIELTGEELDEEIANCQHYGEPRDNDNDNDNGLILVDVFATWCGPCRASVPFLEEAAKRLVNDKVRVVKIDSDKENEWTSRCQVQGLPTILLIQNGEIIDRLEGKYATNEIVSFVQQHTTQRSIFVR